MGLEPLFPPLPAVTSAAEYAAISARFWELVDTSSGLQMLLAMRETMRDYEYSHPEENGDLLIQNPAANR